MLIEMLIGLSGLLISVSIVRASMEISEAIRDPKPKLEISRNMLGQIKKAQVIKKKDDIDELLGE